MTLRQHARFWLIAILVAGLFLYFLADILLPFVLGMAVSYFLDPVADRLEAAGLSRTLATTVITLLFVIVTLAGFVVVVPLIIEQTAGLAERLPEYVRKLLEASMPLIERVVDMFFHGDAESLKQAIGAQASSLVQSVGAIAAKLVGGGLAVVNLVSLLIVTPVVTFYLLRDWDEIVARIDGWLPRRQAGTIRRLARETDRVLAGFVRGQATVCIILALYYGMALLAVGLDFGLVIGLVTGLISFIPFVGAIVGFVASVGVALLQFWPDYPMIAIVGVIFVVGQVLEGNVLTPRLVGGSVGLHPVWVMFGLFAGGSLFGFVGMLIAVPTTAVAGVLARFSLGQYLASPFYHGTAEDADGAALATPPPPPEHTPPPPAKDAP
ncbi:AI-2E family transporter [Oceanibacterium hippocampi]|uniref:AI-2 transport protein TqsA n=1 Tax=Oceanibacterium hippocampi TaxID=745714 RepID=A0A1Y5SUF5_9PROT|nr:AI-2E family transporter [Oceanibacterium hippocampi]SLN48693.1 AI-2 transport protein TqsA [Oceanibacterium hippocampi]